MKLDVLAIGAHPDDIELTCAGTLAKLVRDDRKVGILDLTEGELGTRGTREIRLREAQEAAAVLGVAAREGLGLPDGNILATRENVLHLVTVIRKYRPDILLIPYQTDRHPDHEHAHRLCKEAWFYSGLSKVETTVDGVRQKEHRPGKYYQFMQWFEFDPSFIVDVSDSWEQRLAAIRAFKSQFHDPNSRDPQTILSTPQFMEFITTRAEYYGDRIGVQYGEPFYSDHVPGVADIYAIV